MTFPTDPKHRGSTAGVDWTLRDTFVVILGLGLDEWEDSSNAHWRRTRTLSQFFLQAGVPDAQVLLLEDELGQPQTMRQKLPAFLARSTPDSLLFFYYAGHGQITGDRFYFCHPTASNFVSDEELFTAIEKDFNGRQAVLFADCCFSGALVEQARRRRSNIAYAVMASALRSRESTDNWTFTDCLLAALTGDADVDWNGDGITTFSELVRHTKRVMQETEAQWVDHGFARGFDALFKLAKVNRTTPPQAVASMRQEGWAFLASAPPIGAESDVLAAQWSFDASRRQKCNVVQIDYFISYRREGGGTIARLLHEVLKGRGLVGFLDTESLGEGDYAKAIESHIEQAKNFILVVAPQVFQSEWVVREVHTALRLKEGDDQRKIIPLFTSGVTGFPGDLPESIQDITKSNAIALDHANFDEKLQQLLSWLVTRHSMLVRACLAMWEQKEDGVAEVFAAWRSLVGEEAAMNHLAGTLRQSWQTDQRTTTTDSVLQSVGTWQLKSIAKSLGIEHKGNRHLLMHAFRQWLASGGDLISEDSAYLGQDHERYQRVAKYLAEYYRSRERVAHLKGVVSSLGLIPKNWRSSDSLVAALFDHPPFGSVNDIFHALGLAPEEMKRMSHHFLQHHYGSSSANQEAMTSWVDYQGIG